MKKRGSVFIVSCNTEAWDVYYDNTRVRAGARVVESPDWGMTTFMFLRRRSTLGHQHWVARASGQQATRTVSAFAFYSKGINRSGSLTFYWVILRHRTGFWCGCFIFVPLFPALYRASELGVDWSGFMIWIIENISKSKLFVEERDRETWVALIISWPTTPHHRPLQLCI